MGVSANGNAIFVAPSSRFFLTCSSLPDVWTPPTKSTPSSWSPETFGSAAAGFFVRLGFGSGAGVICFLSPESRGDRRILTGASLSAGTGAEIEFFFRRVGAGLLCSRVGSATGGALCCVFLDLARENWKPSSFSSYAAFAFFAAMPFAFADAAVLPAPFVSVLVLFAATSSASSSSKACRALLLRVGRCVDVMLKV